MPLSGPPDGDLESQLFPCGRRICAFSFHRPFLLWLSIGVSPQKPSLFAVCIFQASSFSQTPPLAVPSGTGFFGGYRCKGLSPVRGLRHEDADDCKEPDRLQGIEPRKGIATAPWLVPCAWASGVLQGIEPRKGIATPPSRGTVASASRMGCKGLSPVRGLRRAHEHLFRRGPSHPSCKGLSPVRGLRRHLGEAEGVD